MKTKIMALVLSSAAATQLACAAADPVEFHERMVDHIKSVRDVLVPTPAIRFVETFPPIAIPRQKILQLAHANPEPFEVAVPPPGEPGAPVDATGIAAWAEDVALTTTQGVMDNLFPRGGGASKRPVIVGGDPKNAATLSEDLTVMMRILEKAAGTKADGPPTAAGIALFSFGQASSPRAFYLEDYGAMFVLNVRFPLLAPPKKDETGRTNETTNSEWEKARAEVYGQRRGFEQKLRNAPGEEFDAQRVDGLQSQLINDLSNAKNIRGLKAGDFVTVVVLGGGQAGGVIHREVTSPGRGGSGGGGRGGGMARMEITSSGGEAGAQSTMTLRAKKSDIDAFANGKLAEDEFRKKVTVQIY